MKSVKVKKQYTNVSPVSLNEKENVMEIRNQSMPSYQERSYNQNGDENLRSVIFNLKCIIAKQDVEIERLRRQLNEERCRRVNST